MPPENQASLASDRHRLRDGRMVTIRSVRPSDELDLLRFLTSRSVSSRRLRLFATACDLGAAARGGALEDPSDRAALVVLDGRGQIAGHAAYVRTYGPRAEVAVEVDDDPHELGLATLLITELARVATERRIDRFVAEVPPDNNAMLAVFRDAFDASAEWDGGVVYVDFPTGARHRGDGLLGQREPASVIVSALPPAPPFARRKAMAATVDFPDGRC